MILTFIYFFLFSRPLVALNYLNDISFFNFSVLDIYGIITTIVFSFFSIVSLRKYKYIFLDIYILFYIFYIFLSFIWGSDFRDSFRLVMPLMAYYAFIGYDLSKTKLKTFYFILIISCSILIFLSSYQIFIGASSFKTIYWTGLQRYTGVFSNIHTLSYFSFLTISFVFMYLSLCIDDNIKINKLFTMALIVIFILSIYCIYKTYTRTVFVGLFMFFFLIMMFAKKYKFIFIYLIIIIGFIFIISDLDIFHNIFFDIIEPLEGNKKIDEIGSGRIGGWTSILTSFFALSFESQILGLGVGNEIPGMVSGSFLGSSHNDYISILISLGFFGIFLQIGMNIIIFSCCSSIPNSSYRNIFLSFILTLFIMSLLSNGYLIRFELSQLLYFIIGANLAVFKRNNADDTIY